VILDFWRFSQCATRKVPHNTTRAQADDMDLFVTCALISSSTVLYSFIWKNPSRWASLVGKQNNPSTVLYYISFVLKILQFSSCFILATKNLPHFGAHNFIHKASTNVVSSVFLSLLFLLGQVLNLSVYYKLTRQGVYYGALLGYKIKWVNEFPYVIAGYSVPDPQYVGCMIAALSILLFINDVSSSISRALIFWLLNYVFLCLLEKTTPGKFVSKVA